MAGIVWQQWAHTECVFTGLIVVDDSIRQWQELTVAPKATLRNLTIC